jgi:hypothetical protein
MAFDAHKNFGLSTVATPPSPATSGTSIIVNAGDGATKFPAAPFNAVIWSPTTQPSAATAEIVRVTAIATDTLTVTRAQEGTTALSIGIGWLISVAVTAKLFTDIETLVSASRTTSAAYSATHTLSADDAVTEENAAGGAYAVNLPAASAALSGKEYVCMKVDASANAVSVTPNGTDTINGVNAATALSAQWAFCRLIRNAAGTGWLKV